jgi:hypothetical protein
VDELAGIKLGTMAKEAIFFRIMTDNSTHYYSLLILWINRLWKAVFPMDKPWEKDDEKCYSQMKEILREAQKDPKVAEEL